MNQYWNDSHFKSMISNQCIYIPVRARELDWAKQCEEKQHHLRLWKSRTALILVAVVQQAHDFLSTPIYYLATTQLLIH